MSGVRKNQMSPILCAIEAAGLAYVEPERLGNFEIGSINEYYERRRQANEARLEAFVLSLAGWCWQEDKSTGLKLLEFLKQPEAPPNSKEVAP